MNNDDEQNELDEQYEQEQQEQADNAAFSDFDPDEYLKRRGGSRYGTRAGDRVETGAMRFSNRGQSARRSATDDNDPMSQVGDSVTSIVSEDTPDTLLTIFRELGPFARIAAITVGCLAAAILVGLCVFIAVVAVQLLRR